ncbi:MAG TPA: efflux RND transporter periplasmic adaptor subunit [Candidatus Krumholzibacteria bacterium]|nr:efflux RND transporter periplasmic adaptor subunit [Candidatus Krumholzibacteria bacterium]
MKKPSRKTLLVSLIAVVVIGAGLAFVAKTRMGIKNSASADSTVTSDSTQAADATDKDKKKDKKKKKGEKVDAPVPVEVTTVAPRSISTYYQTTATLEPEKRVDILSKLAGEVRQILVEEGDFVKEGAILCRLDDAELKVTLEEARINREQQKLEFERVKDMQTQSLISDKEYQQIKYNYEVAENRYQSARVRYEYTQIKAPFSGVVTQRLVDPGENIPMGAKLFMMSDTQPLLLSMYLPESEARLVRKGQRVAIRPDQGAEAEFEGEVLRIAPEVDQRTGTVKVTAQTRAGGVPGSFVRVRILMDTHADVLAVPRRSLLSDAGDRFVFIAAADTVRKVQVGIGYEDETHAEVTEGLAKGDTVVTAGVGGIRDGTKVKVVRPDDVADKDKETASNGEKK